MDEDKQNSVDYAVLAEHSLILERFNNVLTMESIVKGSEAIWGHPDYSPYFKGLIDLRNCSLKFTALEFLQVTKFFYSNRNTARGFGVILATSKNNITHGMIFNSKMSRLMNMHVLSSEETAFQQLGITKDVYDLIDSPRRTRIIIDSEK